MDNLNNDYQRLRNCPFCGRLPEIVEYQTGKKSNFRIECKNMDCQIFASTLWFGTVEDAVESWNRRVKDGDNNAVD